MRVAINGFGRIGRLVLRAFLEAPADKYDFDIVAINDLADINTAVYLFKHDSIHGQFLGDIQKKSGNELVFESNSAEKRKVDIKYFSEKCPNQLPWKELGIDVVLECTGVFKKREQSHWHIEAGAKKVIISCPADDADNTVVFGVNSDTLNPTKDLIISNASCTTNCLAPVVKTLHENIGLSCGFVTTIHSYTGDQRLVDLGHKDLRRCRAAGLSMIPTSTGATKAIEKIFPELKGRLGGLSVRVPTPNVSMIDFTSEFKRPTSVEEVNNSFKRYAEGSLKGILGYTEESLVSCDFCHDSRSAIVDLQLTKVIDGTLAHVVAWYDNEWGFTNRMLDVASVYLLCKGLPICCD